MSNTLLPCPFCGGEALMRERYINGIANTKHYRRECHHCKATFANWYRSMKKADAAWNRRAGKDINVATNADHIRGMSDEELARFLGDEPPYFATYKQYIDWLRKLIEREVEHDYLDIEAERT